MGIVKNKLLPELRFPEFDDAWEVKKGEQLFTSSRTKGREGLPIYSVTLNNGLVPRDSLDRRMENDAATENNLSAQKGDLVYNMMRMWQGAVGLANQECMISPAYVVLRPKKNTDSKFFYFNFNRSRPLYDLWAYSYGLTSDRLRLYFKDFSNINFVVPMTKEEQQKIATFLSSIDAKLNKLRRKRELLEIYKRGLMQKLFSQEIRFKQEDGSDFPDWDEIALGRLGDTISGLTGKSAQDFGNGEKYVTYKQVFGQSDINLSDCGLVNVSKKETQNTLQRGDIVFTTSSEVPHEVGFSSVIVTEVQETVYLNSFCFGLRPYSKEKLVPEFSSYLFRSHEYRKSIFPLAQGSTRYNLSKSSFVKIRLEIPLEKEQKKIAKFLMSMDRKIEAVAKQITQLETFQKGLLQKMFV